MIPSCSDPGSFHDCERRNVVSLALSKFSESWRRPRSPAQILVSPHEPAQVGTEHVTLQAHSHHNVKDPGEFLTQKHSLVTHPLRKSERLSKDAESDPGGSRTSTRGGRFAAASRCLIPSSCAVTNGDGRASPLASPRLILFPGLTCRVQQTDTQRKHSQSSSHRDTYQCRQGCKKWYLPYRAHNQRIRWDQKFEKDSQRQRTQQQCLTQLDQHLCDHHPD